MTSKDHSDRSLQISRVFDAPVELVWKAWTTPERIVNWWGPDGFTNTIRTMDVREGGEWKFIMHSPDGTDYRNEYIYREVVPMKKLVLNHMTGPKFTTIVEFFEEDDRTRMEWTMVFDKASDLERAIRIFRADEGLQQNIVKLEAYLKQIA